MDSTLSLINMEQSRKLETVNMEEKHMIKWKITDTDSSYQYISDEVLINNNQKVVFYAERNHKKYIFNSISQFKNFKFIGKSLRFIPNYFQRLILGELKLVILQ